MKPWIREFLQWLGFAAVCGTSVFLLLLQGSRLPQVGYVPFARACIRMNQQFTGFRVFVIVLVIGAMFVCLHELKRRACAPVQRGDRRIENGGQNAETGGKI